MPVVYMNHRVIRKYKEEKEKSPRILAPISSFFKMVRYTFFQV